MSKLRFATIGTSGICERFCRALALCDDAELVGSYSRDVARAREFGEKFGASRFYDSMDALADASTPSTSQAPTRSTPRRRCA